MTLSLSIESTNEATLGDYIALLKPRVMSLVVFTGLAGLVLAPVPLHPLLAAVAVLCIAMASGASGAINMWWEREIDARMLRTKNRPLPKGKMAPQHALELGLVLLFFAIFIMALAVNGLAALLLAAASAFYIFIYTIWLKPRTPQNIVIGGAAGAFPPMIGWAAATGHVGWEALALFALIFFWTPPHFWALALYRSEDYARAGIPMLPVVAGGRATKIQMLLYTLILFPVALAPFFLGTGGVVYAVTAALLSLGFIAMAVWVLRAQTHRAAQAMFRYSLVYLSVLFAVLMIGKIAGLP
ncbi:MAG TPA: heme o synthase [Alphaproteobacteria bacterium]|nr:heme o synthase [Alphaproteobacteria bacterium]